MTVIGFAVTGQRRALVWADTQLYTEEQPTIHVSKLIVNPTAAICGAWAGWEPLSRRFSQLVATTPDLETLVRGLPPFLRRDAAEIADKRSDPEEFAQNRLVLVGHSERWKQVVGYVLDAREYFVPRLTKTFCCPGSFELHSLHPETFDDLSGVIQQQIIDLDLPVGGRVVGARIEEVIEGVIGVLIARQVANIALPFVQLSAAIAGLSGGGPGSFGALGRAMRAIGLGFAGDQIVKLGAEKLGASPETARLAGDITGGAITGATIAGPIGAAAGAALGGLYWGFTDPATTPRSPNLPPDIEAAAKQAARKYGVPESFFLAQLRAEGGGYNKVSGAGAFGPAQLMPGTAAQLGVATSVNDPNYSWQANLEAGAKYDAMLLRHYNGQLALVAAGYNMGPGRTDQWIKAGHQVAQLNSQTAHYIRQIQANGGIPMVPQVAKPGIIGFDTPHSQGADSLEPSHPIGMGREDRMAIEVTVNHQGNVTRATAKHPRRETVTHVRTATPMPAGGI